VVKPLSAVLKEIGLFSGATVLGSGMLALILDIGATAARAGVKPVEEEIKEAEVLEGNTEGSEVSLLVFEARARERTALPLDVVERIESVPLTQIEYAGGRPLLQYRGELLTLRDEGRVLAELEAVQDRGEEVSVTVLICGGSGKGGIQRTGMVVRRVLDVSGGTLLEKDAVSGELELALVKEKLTMVHREFSVKDAPAWKEVA
jgi:two-component system, chemotaxis family, sensor kinase CheA